MSTQVTTGTFKNVASTPFFIPLSQYVNEFTLYNLTRSGVTSGGVSGSLASTKIVEAYFNQDYMAAGTALIKQNGTVASVLAPLNNGVLPQNGITIFNAANQTNGAIVAIQSFTPGTTTVWGATSHGFQVGDNVRVFGLTSAPQFSGLNMTVTAVTTNTFTTLLNSTGATTSAGSAFKTGSAYLPSKSLYYPENRVIAAITNANPMVVTTLVAQTYAVGDVVTFDIPSVFTVPQLSNQYTGYPIQATVIAANNAVGTQTVTLAVNSTNFGVFGGVYPGPVNNGWPPSSAYPFTFPVMVPQGEGNINNWSAFGVTPAPLPYANQDVLSFARQNQGYNGILIGAGDGTNAVTTGGLIDSNAQVWCWEAVTSLQQYPSVVGQFYV